MPSLTHTSQEQQTASNSNLDSHSVDLYCQKALGFYGHNPNNNANVCRNIQSLSGTSEHKLIGGNYC